MKHSSHVVLALAFERGCSFQQLFQKMNWVSLFSTVSRSQGDLGSGVGEWSVRTFL